MPADTTSTSFRPNTIADDLQHTLRVSLFSGGYAPGQKISIRKLAEEHDVSVIPARDALRALVAEGVLAFTDSRTIAVPVPDAQRLSDIRFARTSLECELARRAFPRFSATERAALRSIDHALDQAIEDNDIRAYAQGNFDFHFYIYKRAEASVMLNLVETLWMLYAPSMREVCTMYGATNIAHDYHRAAMAALDQGDEDAFVDAIANDIAQGMDFIEAGGHQN